MTALRTCGGICSMVTSVRLPCGGTTLLMTVLPSWARIVATWLVLRSPGSGTETVVYANRKTALGTTIASATSTQQTRRTVFHGNFRPDPLEPEPPAPPRPPPRVGGGPDGGPDCA